MAWWGRQAQQLGAVSLAVLLCHMMQLWFEARKQSSLSSLATEDFLVTRRLLLVTHKRHCQRRIALATD
jgi:hypothetical protein